MLAVPCAFLFMIPLHATLATGIIETEEQQREYPRHMQVLSRAKISPDDDASFAKDGSFTKDTSSQSDASVDLEKCTNGSLEGASSFGTSYKSSRTARRMPYRKSDEKVGDGAADGDDASQTSGSMQRRRMARRTSFDLGVVERLKSQMVIGAWMLDVDEGFTDAEVAVCQPLTLTSRGPLLSSAHQLSCCSPLLTSPGT